MKIYVLGSNAFMKAMVEAKDQLCELGYDGWIHPHYEEMVRTNTMEKGQYSDAGEAAAAKRNNDYIRVHYAHILESDAILFVNNTKKGIENYVGGNVLMEMSQAYVNNKKIFLLNDIPREMSYTAEIEAMDPICLHGDLKNIG